MLWWTGRKPINTSSNPLQKCKTICLVAFLAQPKKSKSKKFRWALVSVYQFRNKKSGPLYERVFAVTSRHFLSVRVGTKLSKSSHILDVLWKVPICSSKVMRQKVWIFSLNYNFHYPNINWLLFEYFMQMKIYFKNSIFWDTILLILC